MNSGTAQLLRNDLLPLRHALVIPRAMCLISTLLSSRGVVLTAHSAAALSRS